jgi:hypothetical protein
MQFEVYQLLVSHLFITFLINLLCFFELVFTKLLKSNIPVIVLVVYQRHSSVNADSLKLLQGILDRTSTTLKQYIQSTDKTNKQLIRLASTQSSNMYS